MADPYCTRADMYSNGLPRGALPNPGRLATGANAAADTLALDDHGFALNDVVTLRAESGGVLPEPLAELTKYYAIPVTDASFQLAASVDGAAIDLVTDGSSIVVIAAIDFEAACLAGSRMVDDMLPAALLPLTLPVAPIITITAAEFAVNKVLTMTGGASKSLGDMFDVAMKRVERWSKGATPRGVNAPKAANVAQAASAPYADARGWSKFGGL